MNLARTRKAYVFFRKVLGKIWCSLVNEANNVSAGRSSFEQLKNDEMAIVLKPRHKIVLSSRDIDLAHSGWQQAKSKRAISQVLPAIRSRVRTVQISGNLSGGFCPTSLPLFHGMWSGVNVTLISLIVCFLGRW